MASIRATVTDFALDCIMLLGVVAMSAATLFMTIANRCI